MDYCGSESLAAIDGEWLAGFELESLVGFCSEIPYFYAQGIQITQS